MWETPRRNPGAFLAALLLHLILAVLALTGLDWRDLDSDRLVKPQVVQATIVDIAALAPAPIGESERENRAEQEGQAVAEQQRQAEQRVLEEEAERRQVEEERQRQEEQRRLAEIEIEAKRQEEQQRHGQSGKGRKPGKSGHPRLLGAKCN